MRIPLFLSLPLTASLILAASCSSMPAAEHTDVHLLQAQVDDLNRQLLVLHTASGPDRQQAMDVYWDMLQKQLQATHNMPGVASRNCRDWVLVAPVVPGVEPARAINHCPSLHEAGPAAGREIPAQLAPPLFELTMQQQLGRLRDQVADIAAEADPRERLDLERAHYETRYQDIQSVLGRGWMWTPNNPMTLPDPYSMGAGLFTSYCSQCHQPPPPALHTAGEWHSITGRMSDIIRTQSHATDTGIRVPSPEEFDLIAAYLEAHANGAR